MKVGTSNKDAFIDDGWFRTGDLGYFDDDGELYLVDRQKDMIKYQGYQVAPNDVEAVIEKHCDVDSVVVVGIPDKTADGMFLPAAVVVRSDKNATVTEAEISKAVEGSQRETIKKKHSKLIKKFQFYAQKIWWTVNVFGAVYILWINCHEPFRANCNETRWPKQQWIYSWRIKTYKNTHVNIYGASFVT